MRRMAGRGREEWPGAAGLASSGSSSDPSIGSVATLDTYLEAGTNIRTIVAPAFVTQGLSSISLRGRGRKFPRCSPRTYAWTERAILRVSIQDRRSVVRSFGRGSLLALILSPRPAQKERARC